MQWRSILSRWLVWMGVAFLLGCTSNSTSSTSTSPSPGTPANANADAGGVRRIIFLTNGDDQIGVTREGLLQIDRLLHEFFKPEHNTGRYA